MSKRTSRRDALKMLSLPLAAGLSAPGWAQAESATAMAVASTKRRRRARRGLA